MVAPGAGLGAALAWGVGDFAGGIAARRQPVFVVVLFAQVLGLVLLLALALALGEAIPGGLDLAWGLLAGAGGAVGVTALYAVLAMGRMGIAAPITGVVAAVVPVAVAWALAGAPKPLGMAGIALAIAGIALVSGPKAERPPACIVGLALLSGLGFATFLIFMGLSAGSPVWTLVAARVGSTFLVGALILALPRQAWGKPSWWVVLAGLGDVGGNAFFLLASRLGRLDVAVVLSSLYPIATIAMARILLKERLTLTQALGAVMMLGAIPLVILA